MKYRFLLSAVAVAALALSACSGDGPAASIQTSEQPSTNQASKKPSGAEATVTIGDHVYEFSSDPALTWGEGHAGPLHGGAQ